MFSKHVNSASRPDQFQCGQSYATWRQRYPWRWEISSDKLHATVPSLKRWHLFSWSRNSLLSKNPRIQQCSQNLVNGLCPEPVQSNLPFHTLFLEEHSYNIFFSKPRSFALDFRATPCIHFQFSCVLHVPSIFDLITDRYYLMSTVYKAPRYIVYPHSCYFILLRSKYSPQHFVLKFINPMFLPLGWQTKTHYTLHILSFTYITRMWKDKKNFEIKFHLNKKIKAKVNSALKQHAMKAYRCESKASRILGLDTRGQIHVPAALPFGKRKISTRAETGLRSPSP
jgi:hypothetical protein